MRLSPIGNVGSATEVDREGTTLSSIICVSVFCKIMAIAGLVMVASQVNLALVVSSTIFVQLTLDTPNGSDNITEAGAIFEQNPEKVHEELVLQEGT